MKTTAKREAKLYLVAQPGLRVSRRAVEETLEQMVRTELAEFAEVLNKAR